MKKFTVISLVSDSVLEKDKKYVIELPSLPSGNCVFVYKMENNHYALIGMHPIADFTNLQETFVELN